MVNKFKSIIHIINRVKMDNVGLYMLFKLRSTYDDKPKWKILQVLTKESASKEIYKVIDDFLKSIITQKSLDIIDYHPGPNTDKSVVAKFSANNFDEFSNIIDILISCNTPLPADAKVKYYEPKAFIFKLDTFSNDLNDNSIILFQYLQKQKILKKGLWFNRLSETFVKLDDELFFINNSFDFMYWDTKDEEENLIYIFNNRQFDWLFGFLDQFKEELENEFNEMDEIKEMINVADFVRYVQQDYILLRKTYNALKNGNFKRFFNEETIEKVEEAAPITKLERIGVEEDGEIIVNDNNVKKILNIVNEDYLRSIVSDNVFRSLTKVNMD